MSPKQFTFKTEKPTGKWKSFQSDNHYIKLNGKEVGGIGHQKPFNIYLTVIKKDINEDGNPNCDWKRVKLEVKSDSLLEAKKWLNNSIGMILAKYNLKLL